MDKMEPKDFEFRVQGWLPNTLYEPCEMGTNDRESAISAARALAEGRTYYMTKVVNRRSVEIAHFMGSEYS